MPITEADLEVTSAREPAQLELKQSTLQYCTVIRITIMSATQSGSPPSTRTLDHIVHLTPPGTVHETAEQFRQLGFTLVVDH